MTDPEATRPVLRVVRGEPSADELAALVAVLTTRSVSGAALAPPRRTAWNDPARLVRQPVYAGPGAWRASGLPR